MYNEQIKTKFLNETKQSLHASYKGIFKNTERLEKKDQTDIYNIPTEVIMRYLLENNKKLTSLNTIKIKIRQIEAYKRWAIKENLVDENCKYFEPITNITQFYTESCDTIIFKSPKELIDTLNKYLFRRSESGINSDEIIMAYVVLLYQGFQPDEICQIKVQDVMLVNKRMIIKNERAVFEVYDEFIELLSKIYNCRIYSKKSNYDGNDIVMNEYLISMGDITPDKVYGKIIRFSTNRMFKHIHFTMKDVYIMGQIFKAKLFNKPYKEFRNQLQEDMNCKFAIEYNQKVRTMFENW